jgi:hypothetical protein
MSNKHNDEELQFLSIWDADQAAWSEQASS